MRIKSMSEIDEIVARVLEKLGVEPTKPARWKQHYYISKAVPPLGGKRPDGWICSNCGKHSYIKSDFCSGCRSKMSKEADDDET